MPDYGMPVEVVRLTLVIGVVVSMVIYERLQLTTGGAIVPAFLALAAQRPLAILVTLLAALLTYQIVSVWGARRWILYGRRKFEIEVLTGLGLLILVTVVGEVTGHAAPVLDGLAGVGFLVPGIIAHDMARQTPRRTLLVVVGTTLLLLAIAQVLNLLFALGEGGEIVIEPDLASVLGFPRELLLPAVAISVVTGMVTFSRLGLRSGGFITGAYVALVLPRWGDLLFALVVAVATWAIVVYLLMPRLLIFGRRKLSSMILVAAIVGWGLELSVTATTGTDFEPWRGLTVATLMVPALLANDAQRQGWEKTLIGVSITALMTFGVTNAIAAGAIAAGVL